MYEAIAVFIFLSIVFYWDFKAWKKKKAQEFAPVKKPRIIEQHWSSTEEGRKREMRKTLIILALIWVAVISLFLIIYFFKLQNYER